MFKENLDTKMKVIGYIAFIGSLLSSIIMGIACLVEGSFGLFLLCLLLGFVCAFLSSIPYFVLGQLVENTEIIINKTQLIMNNSINPANNLNHNSLPFATSNANTASGSAVSTISAANTATVSSDSKSPAANLVKVALSFQPITSTFNYVKFHITKLDAEEAVKLADLNVYLTNNDEEGLKSALLTLKDKLD